MDDHFRSRGALVFASLVAALGTSAAYSQDFPCAEATVCGRVIDGTSQPVPGAGVQLVSGVSSSGTVASDVVPFATSSTDREGRFRLVDVPGGPRAVVVRAAHHAPRLLRLEAGAVKVELVLTLEAAADLALELPAHLPRDATVEIIDGAGLQTAWPVKGAKHMRCDDLAPGEGRARINGRRWHAVSLRSGEAVPLRLSVGVLVSGVVRRGGESVTTAHLAAWQVRDRRAVRVGDGITDEHGRFRLDSLPSGSVRLVATDADAHARGERTLTVAEGEEREIQIDLEGNELEVLVSSAGSGDPIEGASLTLIDPAAEEPCPTWQPLPEGDSGSSTFPRGVCGSDQAMTDASGMATLVTGGLGERVLSVSAEGYPLRRERVVVASERARVAISLPKGADRCARLTVANAPQGCAVSPYCLGAGTMEATRTAPGEWSCCGLPAGVLDVLVRTEGCGVAYRRLAVPESGDVDVALSLGPAATLEITRCMPDAPVPEVTDRAGTSWTRLLLAIGAIGQKRTTWNDPLYGSVSPEVWVFDGLPLGTYVALIPDLKKVIPEEYDLLTSGTLGTGCGAGLSLWKDRQPE